MGESLQSLLNKAHHDFFRDTPEAWLVGHDISDPLGGYYGVVKGLSTEFPDRVRSISASEATLIGIGTGLALTGQRAVVEVDSLAKGMDVLLNFASDATIGKDLEMNLVIRCPYGGAGQASREKYLVGFPRISVFELSPFHAPAALLAAASSLGHPSILYEDRNLYSVEPFHDGKVDDIFEFTLASPLGFAKVHSPYFIKSDCVIISAGGTSPNCVAAARRLYEDHEIECQVVVPARLFPFNIDEIRDILTQARLVFIVEDGLMGGGWGDAVAAAVTPAIWGRAVGPVINKRLLYAELDSKARASSSLDEIVQCVVAEVSAARVGK